MDVSVSALGYYKEAAPPDLFARAPQQAKVKMSISPRWFPSPRIRNNMWAVSSMKSIFSARKTILKLNCKGLFNTRWREKVSLSFCEFLFIQILSGVCSQLNKTAQFTVNIELRLLNIFHLIECFRKSFCHLSHLTLLFEAYRLRKKFQSTALSVMRLASKQNSWQNHSCPRSIENEKRWSNRTVAILRR